MEDLIQKINDLIQAINKNSVPLWISIIGIFVPIFISIAVIVITVIQNIKNKKLQEQLSAENAKLQHELREQSERLQRELSDKEIKVQMHSDIMEIYNDFTIIQKALICTKEIFKENNSTNIIALDINARNNYITLINDAFNASIATMNKARLIIPKEDNELRDVLDKIYNSYKSLYYKIIAYLYNKAMNSDINNDTETLLKLFQYENFDVHFEKYLRIEIGQKKGNAITTKSDKIDKQF